MDDGPPKAVRIRNPPSETGHFSVGNTARIKRLRCRGCSLVAPLFSKIAGDSAQSRFDACSQGEVTRGRTKTSCRFCDKKPHFSRTERARNGASLLPLGAGYPFTIFFWELSQTATVLLKYEKLARWQQMAALLPKTSFSTTGLRVRTAL